MDVRPIRTEEDYDWALAEVSQYFASEPARGTPEGDRFEVLLALLELYEERHFPVRRPDPVEMLKYIMDMKGKSQSDLTSLLGSRSRASEVLNGRRPLTLSMISRLHHDWGIPSDLLIPASEDAAA